MKLQNVGKLLIDVDDAEDASAENVKKAQKRKRRTSPAKTRKE